MIAGRGAYRVTNRAAIAQTMAGLNSAVISSVALSAPPSRSGYTTGNWFRATIGAEGSSSPEHLLPYIWQASLAQGAIADRIAGARQNLANVIVDSTISIRSLDGTLRPVAGGAGDVSSHQLFAAQAENMSDRAIERSMGATLRSYGLTPVRIQVLHPLGPAVSVRAKVGTLGDMRGRFASLLNALNPGQSSYEGLYLELDRDDGTPVVRASQSLRAGMGQVWFAPGMDRYLGITHG